MWPDILHLSVHSLTETLKLLPFLFLSYLLMEFLEHKSGNAPEKLLRGSGKIGPLFGGLFGAVPQCGFSVAATGLYTGRVITVGTLIAIYLATSDEMLPILVSEGAPVDFVIKILLTKALIGVAAGFIIDAVFSIVRKKRHAEQKPQIEELCEREHCHCHHSIALSALKHTLKIALFILIFSFVLHGAIELVGEANIKAFAQQNSVIGILVASFLGLIPNCASSIIITELYLEGVLSIGAMLAGLLINSGIAVAVLFKNNRPITDSLRILALLYAISISIGIIVDITPVSQLISI